MKRFLFTSSVLFVADFAVFAVAWYVLNKYLDAKIERELAEEYNPLADSLEDYLLAREAVRRNHPSWVGDDKILIEDKELPPPGSIGRALQEALEGEPSPTPLARAIALFEKVTEQHKREQ